MQISDRKFFSTSLKVSPGLLLFLLMLTLADRSYSQQTAPASQSQQSEKQVAEGDSHGATTDLLGGQWNGYWVSCKTGHRGKLKATFCRLNDSQVQAVFVGSFARILPFRYRAVLQVIHEEPGLIQLRGSQRLGPIMGTFTYEATITADQFRATYGSRRDCGEWNMERTVCECR